MEEREEEDWEVKMLHYLCGGERRTREDDDGEVSGER